MIIVTQLVYCRVIVQMFHKEILHSACFSVTTSSQPSQNKPTLNSQLLMSVFCTCVAWFLNNFKHYFKSVHSVCL